ncbi:hypothetical protein BDV96DRAFT_658540 [Lophiotrema nucula]|uniref:HTH APSES-type domain-containing protein n=1 Tax=Lophiotrema nucula TaxID=690887 RepID=A0A6A5ZAM2_9PLEO|nr:hypothetical protein BDV96DRAFT_658540 [Lophiotrema nucula]
MKIQSLLNPFSCDQRGYRSSQSPTPPTARPTALSTSDPKRQKLSKDAMRLDPGTKPVGPVNFPPYEADGDETIAAMHRKFRIHPAGKIALYHRHIPYTSSKKEFTEKTGRSAFEVFQYQFMLPDDDKEWVVVWDYNVGLVRITPFFKSLKYNKTMPAKVLDKNAGLKGISYSITGGALTAQGYWVPYPAAKALAATFCYEIRYALTPIFGNDFLSLCIPPEDPLFAKFKIDLDIVRESIDDCARWKADNQTNDTSLSPPMAPMRPLKAAFGSPSWDQKNPKQRRKKPERDFESGYFTDTSQSDKCFFSPEVSPRTQTWNAINRSCSPTDPPRSSPYISHLPAVPSGSPSVAFHRRHGLLPPIEDEQLDAIQYRTKRTLSKAAYEDEEMEATAPYSSYDSDADDEKAMNTSPDSYISPTNAEQLDAAHALIAMKGGNTHTHAAQIALHPPKRTRRGSKF